MSEKGHWVTIKGTPVYIEDGQSVEEAFAAREKASRLLNMETPEEKGRSKEAQSHGQRLDAVAKGKALVRSGDLPEGVVGRELLGGTMDLDGKPVDMRGFKDGYLVSCGNASMKSNKDFILSDAGADFVAEFMANSDDGRLYLGSWFENGGNTNEYTIWVKDLDKAKRLAKATGQYSITDCAAYNRHGCDNYKLLDDVQGAHAGEIFIDVCGDKEHVVDLRKVKL